ncbi:nitrogen regulation protein NR(I), partial [Halomonas sp. BBD48]|nr:nitrogen regulation protein NR(I) [Halomonas sp. BBD48]
TETKVLTRDAEEHLTRLPWPGNVRQLENTCRWLTVMASGREVLVDDLPPELRDVEGTETASGDWRSAFREWADRALAAGHTHLLEEAVPDFERILIETALKHTGGRKGEAAELLGWGRNTLTRKVKVLLPALAED